MIMSGCELMLNVNMDAACTHHSQSHALYLKRLTLTGYFDSGIKPCHPEE
jgi:hypothetical protein